MKNFLSLVIAFAAVTVFGGNILWVGIDPDAIIDFGSGTQMSVAQWVASLPDPEWDAGFRIRTADGTVLPEAFTGGTEAGGVYFDEAGSGRWTPFLWQTDVSSVDSSSRIFYDLLKWDYSADDWAFVATASAVLSDLGDKTYTTGDINPMYAVEWKPSFYGAIPEPAPANLALLGFSCS